jgi:WD40 repeat protein
VENLPSNDERSLVSQDAVRSLAFLSDGKTLPSGSVDSTIAVYQLDNTAEVRRRTEHGPGITWVAFSPKNEEE